VASGSSDAVLGGDLPHVYGNGEDAKVSLREYIDAIRRGDKALEEERDRRYAEVKAAEEKALKVKETADAIALGLQRDYQAYKDIQANNLREQINRERNLYVTRDMMDSTLREVKAGTQWNVSTALAAVAALAAILAAIFIAVKG
jgi:chromatin segregation and condensation protein Rec8/ScpA/Scc1 (kleisin family)